MAGSVGDNLDVIGGGEDKLRQLGKSKGFLGKEFLTWLWYQAETTGGSISVTPSNSGGGGGAASEPVQIELWVDDRVTLEAAIGHVHTQTLKGGDPSQSAEASTALRAGKVVKEMKLGMNVPGIGEITCVLGADELAPRSLQLPQPADELHQDEGFSLLSFRLLACEQFCAILDGLFALFLESRLDQGEYLKVRQDMKQWVQARSTREQTLLH